MSIVLALITALGLIGGTLAQVAPPWRHQVEPLPTAQIAVGGVPLIVELALDNATRARGLSYRDGLAPGTGMLFIFPEPGPQTFVMRGMRFCLDMVWIADDMVAGATEYVCPTAADTLGETQPTYPSPLPVQYVLEVPAGWLDMYGLGIGSPVEGLPRVLNEPAAEQPAAP